MFVLTKREQRAVIVIVLALVGIALAKHYRDVGTIIPTPPRPSPEVSATPSSIPEEEQTVPEDGR
jgi:hypothetical protein